MIKLQMEGLDELQDYIDSLIKKLDSEEFWDSELRGIMEDARRFAASISPVVTGSYRAAHRVVVGQMKAELSIDPTARNSRSGVLVSRYAGPVEVRHQVYARTNVYTQRLAAQGAEVLVEGLLG